MKKQAVIIHGGDTFDKYEAFLTFLNEYEIDIERYAADKKDWKPWLRQKLGDTYEVMLPAMPNKSNAQFNEWKIWFEKITAFLNDGVMLIGHSLGASFLAKYLSENKFPVKISGVFLVSGVFDKDSEGGSLASFSLPKKLNLQSEHIYLYHSKDDPIVPFSEMEKFRMAIPNTHVRILENRQHINQQEFPELVEDILKLKA